MNNDLLHNNFPNDDGVSIFIFNKIDPAGYTERYIVIRFAVALLVFNVFPLWNTTMDNHFPD